MVIDEGRGGFFYIMVHSDLSQTIHSQGQIAFTRWLCKQIAHINIAKHVWNTQFVTGEDWRLKAGPVSWHQSNVGEKGETPFIGSCFSQRHTEPYLKWSELIKVIKSPLVIEGKKIFMNIWELKEVLFFFISHSTVDTDAADRLDETHTAGWANSEAGIIK